MVTEPVILVGSVLVETSMECVVMGFRGVANGLEFLHTKAGLSHNNLSMLSVYVSTLDSQWKIGGFETAIHHKKIDAKVCVCVSECTCFRLCWLYVTTDPKIMNFH